MNTSNISNNSSTDIKETVLADNIQLSDISLKIHKGEFICIIGEVGSGKSSLLSAILGDMLYLSDDVIEQYKDSALNAELRATL